MLTPRGQLGTGQCNELLQAPEQQLPPGGRAAGCERREHRTPWAANVRARTKAGLAARDPRDSLFAKLTARHLPEPLFVERSLADGSLPPGEQGTSLMWPQQWLRPSSSANERPARVQDFRLTIQQAAVRYAEVLGLEPVMDLGWIVTFAAPGNPAAQISVMREDATASVVPDASIEVDDVDAAHAAAQRLGCEIAHPLTDEPWGVRRFLFATLPARCSTSSAIPKPRSR